MAIQLQKKVPVSLDKVDGGPKNIIAGLGWDPEVVNGHPVDLDLSLFMMGANGKLLTDEYFVFYNNPASPDGSVFYPGDSRAGDGDGDDEIITIDLQKMNEQVEFLYIAVTIDQAEERGHHFGHVKNAYIGIRNAGNNSVMCTYQLNENFAQEDSLIIATITRNGGVWDLEAVGQAFAGGLGTLVELYQ
ncbi:TerD family protein [Mucilaginibacter calamicampi]|uniref:TerD family protein n=1 Tax=Mucilaginibacter calamicampi TaxID=1302352 RepID=A0ABW2YUF6_9SPHI